MSDSENSHSENKKKSTLDKVVMGAIIGTAIGASVGASMAPKSGKETRKILKDKGKEISQEAKEIGKLTKETTSGLFKLAKNLLFGRKKKKQSQDAGAPIREMKKIPNEMEVSPEEYAE